MRRLQAEKRKIAFTPASKQRFGSPGYPDKQPQPSYPDCSRDTVTSNASPGIGVNDEKKHDHTVREA